MLSDYTSLAGIILVLGFYLTVGAVPNTVNWARTCFSILALFLGVRYINWRITETVLPYTGESTPEMIWIWLVLIVEVMIYIEVFVFLTIMSRYHPRGTEADAREILFEAQNTYPPVDVFIPTYNEPIEVLEKTIIGAANMDYPDFTVWVLDDQRRDWLREFCEDFDNVNYLTRPDNTHAKAGNMNNGLAHATGEYVCVFDADFVPHRNFIRRTIGFFDDPQIGIVQTPQHFFNKDPIQTNLGIDKEWPDEQRLFFDKMAECRDAWDVSFCCGSCSIIRRQALDEIGGFPTESITEDLLTTLKMYRRGYITRYLNEKLSMGLAAESLEAFFVQRGRWCQGGIQSIFLPDGPLGSGVSWIKRIMFFPWSWIIQYPTRFVIMLIPMVYLWTGLSPLVYTDFDDLISYQAPMFLMYFLTMMWMLPGHYMPLLSTAQGLFATFRLLPTVITSIINPFGTPFRVTPKGTNNNTQTFDKITFFFIFGVILATLAGVMINLFPETQVLSNTQFFPVALGWAVFNVLTMGIAAMMCFDAPRKRAEERFEVRESVTLWSGDQSEPATMFDISVGGARTCVSNNDVTHLEITGVGKIPVKLIRRFPWKNPVYCTFTFEHTTETRRALIAHLFSGKYSNTVQMKAQSGIFQSLWRRAFGKNQ